MSELIDNPGRADIRKYLLGTASALVLFASIAATQDAHAQGDADRPTVWIELGGQLERMDGGQSAMSPPFLASPPSFVTTSPSDIQRLSRYSVGVEGALSFEPEGSDWVFSASVRYGRSNSSRHAHLSQYVSRPTKYIPPFITAHTAPTRDDFYNADTKSKESHTVLDFTAGKDFGIGLFGREGSAVFSGGVRFAQFTTGVTAGMQLRPDLQYYNVSPPPKYRPYAHFHNFEFSGKSERSFRGIGPSLSLSGSSPFLGNTQSAEFAFDWGVNAALLFGKQKVRIDETTKGNYVRAFVNRSSYPAHYTSPVSWKRAHSVVVPNIGGVAGLSLKFPNAKVSVGYRADFFFGAMDGGIDARRTGNVGFFGPFATIGIGLGG